MVQAGGDYVLKLYTVFLQTSGSALCTGLHLSKFMKIGQHVTTSEDKHSVFLGLA